MGNKQLQPETKEDLFVFSKEEIRILYENFNDLDLKESGLIDFNEFINLPNLSSNPIVKKVLKIFDKNNDGKISFFEYIQGLSILTDLTLNKFEKLNFAFKIYDFDEDGYISNGDLFKTIKFFIGNSLMNIHIQQLVDRTMILADKDCDGKLSFDEFVDFVRDVSVYELFSMNLFNWYFNIILGFNLGWIVYNAFIAIAIAIVIVNVII